MAGSAIAAVPIKHRNRGVVGIEVTLGTTAGGVVDETVIGEAYGRLMAVYYDGGLDAAGTVTFKHQVGPSAVSTAFFTHTTGTEGTPVSIFPTDISTDNAGVDLTPAASAPNVRRPIIVGGKITVTVAAGGASETGKYVLVFDEAGIGDLALTV